MSFLLTGQTDSGKSTIAGHLLWKVGYFETLPEEDRKAYRVHLENLESSSSKSKFSILLDVFDGQVLNNKTKTQEFSIHEFSYHGKSLKLIDTPGHQLYIRSLLEGLFHVQPQVVCLVISCLENEFWEAWERGTVKEDLLLTRSIGCRHLVLLWNKSDICAPTAKMEQTLTTFCKGLNFQSVDNLQVSGTTGKNLDKLLDVIVQRSMIANAHVVIPPIFSESKYLNVRGMFFMDDEKSVLISRGLQFVLHHSSGEYDTEIEKLEQNGKDMHFIRTNDVVKMVLVCHKALPIQKGSRVVFRHQKNTIGFGVLLDCVS